MKVGLIGTLPEAGRNHYRGPERATIGLAEALQDRDHQVTVIADEGDAETVDVPAQILGQDLSPGVDRMIRFYLRMRRQIDFTQFDVVHSWRPAPNVDVLSLHSVNSTETIEKRRPGTFSWKWRIGAKFELSGKFLTSKSSKRTIVTAKQNANDAENNNIYTDNIIPVGVDESFLRPNINEEGVNLLNVGRINQIKNQSFISKHTPERHNLQFVGPVEEKSYVEQIEGFERHWCGPQFGQDLLEYYQKADVYILPSVNETFGLTAVEAMAAQTPVVVSSTCAVSEHVAESDAGKVYEFENVEDYRTKLQEVIEDRDRMGANAQRYVRDNLTWDVIATQYETEYENIGDPQ